MGAIRIGCLSRGSGSGVRSTANARASRPAGNLSMTGPSYDSQFRLTIRDVQTHSTLWGLTEHGQSAVLQENRDKNFEKSLGGILVELKKIAGPGAAGAAAAKQVAEIAGYHRDDAPRAQEGADKETQARG